MCRDTNFVCRYGSLVDREGFDGLGIEGGFQEVASKNEHYRVFKEFDPDDADVRSLIADMLGASCLHNTAVALRRCGTCAANTPAAACLEFLSGFRSVEPVLRSQ